MSSVFTELLLIRKDSMLLNRLVVIAAVCSIVFAASNLFPSY